MERLFLYPGTSQLLHDTFLAETSDRPSVISKTSDVAKNTRFFPRFSNRDRIRYYAER